MAKKYLDYDGLLYFWQKIKTMFVTDVTYTSSSRKIQKTKAGTTSDVVTLSTVATSGSYDDLSNKPTIPSGVEKSTTTPKMDGTASVGSEVKFAAGDHVHPSDTSRVPTTREINGIPLSANIDLTGDDITVSDTITDLTLAEAINELDQDVIDLQDNKVDKVTGKGLSTNDYTTAEKNKLAGIEAGAEVNVNADWNATSGDAQILNKPTLGAAASKGVVTSISSDSANLPTVTAVKNYVQTAITGSASFQGTAPTNFAPTNYKSGYYWVVGTAGTYAGQVCEPGDMIFAVADGTTYSASDFNVIQTNLDITSITNAEIDTIVAS